MSESPSWSDSEGQSLKRFKKYGLKGKSLTVSEETIVVEKKDKLECCQTNKLVGGYIGLLLWITICVGTFLGIRFGVYKDNDLIQKRAKLHFASNKGGVCPPPYKDIPWYYYYEEDGKIHCYWIAATPSEIKVNWWDARKNCQSLKDNLNNADIGNTATPGKKILSSDLFIPETGDIMKDVSLAGECWDVMKERPQQRMGMLEKPFNVWTNKFFVEGSNPLHKRILELEESYMLSSYRNYHDEPSLRQTYPNDREEKRRMANCDFDTYGANNQDVQDANEISVPFCVNLATYADPTKMDQGYNRDEEPEWTWYSYPCNWKSLYICEAEMETTQDNIKMNKQKFQDNRDRILDYWQKQGKSGPVQRNFTKVSL